MSLAAVVPGPAVWLCVLNLALIAALPRAFFRPGRLNASWWLTAAPFMLAGAGLVHGTVTGAVTHGAPQLVAITLSAASILLIGLALGSHAEPVSLWHQQDDTPARVVSAGAYRRIRHPFYTAFQLGLAACVIAAPGTITAAALLGAMVQLRRTAIREERRLQASPLGAEYSAYMLCTGRFVPRLRQPGGPLRPGTGHPAGEG